MDITETDEYQNWQAAAADVDFLASEHRPELSAAMTIEERALAALNELIERMQNND